MHADLYFYKMLTASKKSTILYVDDEPGNLKAFQAVFRRLYDVDIANSGEEGLNKLGEKEYIVIISDQRMPQMTGVEFLNKVKTLSPESIRMILTGYSDKEAIIDAINVSNIYYYVTKPWISQEFELILEKAIETYTLRQANKNLEKDNLQAQLRILQNQINPHFLFNCLNVLGSLISIDQDKAIMFTKEFARLYRRILEVRDELVVSLEEEIDFVNAFMYLQKMRFDDSIQYSINVPSEFLSYTLPPFAIQLVLENCIKHNIISEKNHLFIEIKESAGQLIISNNLQKRQHIKDSTGTGLNNIIDRYKILNAQLPTFTETETQYEVTLPLIE